MTENREQAIFAGGCFWGVEHQFQQLDGVVSAMSGYTGGTLSDPTYRQVCTGTTGHAEVIQIDYDPEQISFRQLLEIFFTFHDPTTLNRQGADVGTQYRSIVLYHDDEQKQAVGEVIADLEGQGLWGKQFVTQIEPLGEFFEAEEYHHRYYERNPNQGYCRAVIAPKVSKFRKQYASLRKSAQPA